MIQHSTDREPDQEPELNALAAERRERSPAEEPGRRSPPVSDEPKRPGLTWYRDRLLLSTLAAVLVVDQVSKLLVVLWLDRYDSWPDQGFVRLTHALNSGTAFGLFPNHTTLLVAASLLAIGFLFYFYRAHALPVKLLRFGIGLQLGGALGNLIDRLRHGYVVDFIDVGPWPVFNLADSSIVIGIALVVFLTLLANDDRGEQVPRRTQAE